jgi:hypothetical protein
LLALQPSARCIPRRPGRQGEPSAEEPTMRGKLQLRARRREPDPLPVQEVAVSVPSLVPHEVAQEEVAGKPQADSQNDGVQFLATTAGRFRATPRVSGDDEPAALPCGYGSWRGGGMDCSGSRSRLGPFGASGQFV